MRLTAGAMPSRPELLAGQFAEWKARFEEKKAAIRQAELEDKGARSLQVHMLVGYWCRAVVAQRCRWGCAKYLVVHSRPYRFKH